MRYSVTRKLRPSRSGPKLKIKHRAIITHPSKLVSALGYRIRDDKWVCVVWRRLERQRQRGAGAFALNGRMVDAPFVRRAEFILALAEMIRMPEAGGVEV